MKIKEGPWGLLLRKLPKGCKFCIKGQKMVIFITGLCNWPKSCRWYCPVSSVRKGKDITFANERKINRENEEKDLIEEAIISGSQGASITGGEPFLVFSRVIKYLTLLKDYFGEAYHIHLYTNGTLVTEDKLIELKKAKLDEIRFHSLEDNIIKKVKLASKVGLKAGLEVPVVPGFEKRFKELINKADKEGIEFINLNEFEATYETYKLLQQRGFKINKDSTGSILKSKKSAIEILGWSKRNTKNISIHFCPIWVKDNVQLKNRFLRTAQIIKKPHEEVTTDGLIIKGAVIPERMNPASIRRIIEFLVRNGFSDREIVWNNKNKWIEVPYKKLTQSIGKLLVETLSSNVQIAIVEEFPTAEREVINLTYL